MVYNLSDRQPKGRAKRCPIVNPTILFAAPAIDASTGQFESPQPPAAPAGPGLKPPPSDKRIGLLADHTRPGASAPAAVILADGEASFGELENSARVGGPGFFGLNILAILNIPGLEIVVHAAISV
jgi:hypothetical protein